MRILSRAVFREVIGSVFLGTLLFTFVLFLQRLGSNNNKLFEILVRGSATPSTVGHLLLLAIPPALIFSIPVGTLVGVLIGLGRMASDGEITAMRAAGVPSRSIVGPIVAIALLMTVAAGYATLWLTPQSLRDLYRLANQVAARQLTAAIQPRVFEEQFTNTNTVLYVGDVPPSSGTAARWSKVFIADIKPAAERTGRDAQLGDYPVITIANEAIAVPDVDHNRIRLSMKGVSMYFVEKEKEGSNPYGSTMMATMEQVLAAKPRAEEAPKESSAMDTRDLFVKARTDRDASIELHKRFALPFACLLLAVIGIPLGISSRKSGKSVAFVLTVFLALLYYMGLISMIGLAEQGRLSPPVAVWTPNALFALAALVLLVGMERPGDRDLLSRVKTFGAELWWRIRTLVTNQNNGHSVSSGGMPRIPFLPGIIDTYVLSTFLFWFAALLAAFVAMAHVFIFFDLLGDIFSSNTPMFRVATYHLFLTPKLIYDSTPMAVLVAVLVTFGVLAKNNEVNAMKACGVSLYRLSIPVILTSLLISAALFGFDHYYIPEANRVQDGILNEIKGRPTQTFQRPDRKWIFGEGSRIYFYKYLDPDENLMAGVNVYELDEKSYRLTRHIFAESARWEPGLKAWSFHDGWVKDFRDASQFERFQAKTFRELTETPAYFLQEVKQVKQLNYLELDKYIRDLEQSGLNTIPLKVQFHKKFSVPAFALIMALISAPFAFLTGNRGAMAGVGVSFGIAIAYYAAGKIFEEIGNVNQLPAIMAAWSPDAVFALAGMYLFTRMRT